MIRESVARDDTEDEDGKPREHMIFCAFRVRILILQIGLESQSEAWTKSIGPHWDVDSHSKVGGKKGCRAQVADLGIRRIHNLFCMKTQANAYGQ